MARERKQGESLLDTGRGYQSTPAGKENLSSPNPGASSVPTPAQQRAQAHKAEAHNKQPGYGVSPTGLDIQQDINSSRPTRAKAALAYAIQRQEFEKEIEAYQQQLYRIQQQHRHAEEEAIAAVGLVWGIMGSKDFHDMEEQLRADLSAAYELLKEFESKLDSYQTKLVSEEAKLADYRAQYQAIDAQVTPINNAIERWQRIEAPIHTDTLNFINQDMRKHIIAAELPDYIDRTQLVNDAFELQRESQLNGPTFAEREARYLRSMDKHLQEQWAQHIKENPIPEAPNVPNAPPPPPVARSTRAIAQRLAVNEEAKLLFVVAAAVRKQNPAMSESSSIWVAKQAMGPIKNSSLDDKYREHVNKIVTQYRHSEMQTLRQNPDLEQYHELRARLQALGLEISSREDSVNNLKADVETMRGRINGAQADTRIKLSGAGYANMVTSPMPIPTLQPPK